MAKNITGYLLPALLLGLALPIGAYAADAGNAAAKQASTASAHAGMALGAADLKMAHTHLQHVVNCLEGTSGADFKAAVGNPCKGMGNGAITDAKGDAATETKLKEGLAQAKDGLAATTLDAAHADAQKSMSTLQAK